MAATAGSYSYAELATRDADEQAERLRRWDQTYDQISPGAFAGRLIDCWFGDIQLFRETTNQSVHEDGNAWPGSVALAVPMAMNGTALFRGRAMTGDTILAVDSALTDLDFLTPPLLDVVAITVEKQVLARFCREVEGAELAAVMKGRALIACPPECMAQLRGLLESVFTMLGTSHGLLEQPQIRRALQDALLTNVLAALAAAGDQTIDDCPQGRRRVVERAKAYVLSKPDEPVTVAELCSRIGVSRRKLQYCFQEVLGHNPLTYLRAVRLNRVRRDLKTERPKFDSVQQAAANWGFWHLSHFTADYKAMFGELPSQTLRRSRGEPARPLPRP